MTDQHNLFVSGTDGCHTYRIPSLFVTPRKTVLAFCEGRVDASHDNGRIDLVVKRSEDVGTTWSGQGIVWSDGEDTCGNPCPVADETTGRIWMPMTWNPAEYREGGVADRDPAFTRRVFVSYSDDDGRTWAAPREITASVKRPDWEWYATGPGVGIQLRRGPHSGRLVVPCDHSRLPHICESHAIYSDDHGETWTHGGSTGRGGNECQVVELANGTLLLNMRMQTDCEGFRASTTSTDGGETWGGMVTERELPDCVCMGSLIRYEFGDRDRKAPLLFSNPATSAGTSDAARHKLTVRASFDEWKTWPRSKLLCPGPSAYSCLATLPDGSVGCLYEAGEVGPYDRIVFERFPFESI